MRRALITTGIVLIGTTLLWAYGPDRYALEKRFYLAVGDALDRKIKDMGGKKYLNCGRIDLSEDEHPEPLNRCAEKAIQNKVPFYLRYDAHGIDSRTASGLFRNTRDEVYELHFDGDPHGQGGISFTRQRAWANLCKNNQVKVGRRGRLECRDTDWRIQY